MGSVQRNVTFCIYQERSPDRDGDVGIIGPVVRQRIRLHFSKKGNLCFIGHRDLLRTMDRLFRRARLSLELTQGFHPKTKISYLAALPLGYGGEDELVELVLEDSMDTEELLSRLNACSVDGLVFSQAQSLGDTAAKMKAVAFDYRLEVPPRLLEQADEVVAAFLAKESMTAVKPNGKTVEVRRYVEELVLDASGTLRLRLKVGNGPEATVREVLACLGWEAELFRTVFPARTQAVLA